MPTKAKDRARYQEIKDAEVAKQVKKSKKLKLSY
jgi:hypothetical protein